MANPELTKNYIADEVIGEHLLVKSGTADANVGLADAVTDLIIGVSELGGDAVGDHIDVIHSGIATVKLGGTVTRGNHITAGANGAGVQAAPATGTNARTVGVALQSGVIGDLIDVLIGLGEFQGA